MENISSSASEETVLQTTGDVFVDEGREVIHESELSTTTLNPIKSIKADGRKFVDRVYYAAGDNEENWSVKIEVVDGVARRHLNVGKIVASECSRQVDIFVYSKDAAQSALQALHKYSFDIKTTEERFTFEASQNVFNGHVKQPDSVSGVIQEDTLTRLLSTTNKLKLGVLTVNEDKAIAGFDYFEGSTLTQMDEYGNKVTLERVDSSNVYNVVLYVNDMQNNISMLHGLNGDMNICHNFNFTTSDGSTWSYKQKIQGVDAQFDTLPEIKLEEDITLSKAFKITTTNPFVKLLPGTFSNIFFTAQIKDDGTGVVTLKDNAAVQKLMGHQEKEYGFPVVTTEGKRGNVIVKIRGKNDSIDGQESFSLKEDDLKEIKIDVESSSRHLNIEFEYDKDNGYVVIEKRSDGLYAKIKDNDSASIQQLNNSRHSPEIELTLRLDDNGKTEKKVKVNVLGKNETISGRDNINFIEGGNTSENYTSSSKWVSFKDTRFKSSVGTGEFTEDELKNIILVNQSASGTTLSLKNNSPLVKNLVTGEKKTGTVILELEDGTMKEVPITVTGVSTPIVVGRKEGECNDIYLFEKGLVGGTQRNQNNSGTQGEVAFVIKEGGNGQYKVSIDRSEMPSTLAGKTVKWRDEDGFVIGSVDGRDKLSIKIEQKTDGSYALKSELLGVLVHDRSGPDSDTEIKFDIPVKVESIGEDDHIYKVSCRILDDAPLLVVPPTYSASNLLNGNFGMVGADGGFIKMLVLDCFTLKSVTVPRMTITFDGSRFTFEICGRIVSNISVDDPSSLERADWQSLSNGGAFQLILRGEDKAELALKIGNEEVLSVNFKTTNYTANGVNGVTVLLADGDGDHSSSPTYDFSGVGDRSVRYRRASAMGEEANQKTADQHEAPPSKLYIAKDGVHVAKSGREGEGFIFNQETRDVLTYTKDTIGRFKNLQAAEKHRDAITGFMAKEGDAVDLKDLFATRKNPMGVAKERLQLTLEENEQLTLTIKGKNKNAEGVQKIQQQIVFKDWYESNDYRSFADDNKLSGSQDMQALLDTMLEKSLILVV